MALSILKTCVIPVPLALVVAAIGCDGGDEGPETPALAENEWQVSLAEHAQSAEFEELMRGEAVGSVISDEIMSLSSNQIRTLDHSQYARIILDRIDITINNVAAQDVDGQLYAAEGVIDLSYRAELTDHRRDRNLTRSIENLEIEMVYDPDEERWRVKRSFLIENEG